MLLAQVFLGRPLGGDGDLHENIAIVLVAVIKLRSEHVAGKRHHGRGGVVGLSVGGVFQHDHARHSAHAPQRHTHHRAIGILAGICCGLAADGIGAAAGRVIMDDLLLVHGLFHDATRLDQQFLLLVEFISMRQGNDLDVLALEPAQRHSRCPGPRRQFITDVLAGSFKTFECGDGAHQLQYALVAGGH